MLPYTLPAFSALAGVQHYHFLNACIVLILASCLQIGIHTGIFKYQKMRCIISFFTCTEKLQYVTEFPGEKKVFQ